MRRQAKKKSEEQEEGRARLAEREVYLRQRQSFMATRVNIQQLQGSDTFLPNMSTYIGFAAEQQEQSRASSLRSSAELALQHPNPRQRPGESFGILLPNVQKNQYRRYDRTDRFKGSKNLGDRSVSTYVHNLVQSQMGEGRAQFQQMKLGREISLGERIRSRISDKF